MSHRHHARLGQQDDDHRQHAPELEPPGILTYQQQRSVNGTLEGRAGGSGKTAEEAGADDAAEDPGTATAAAGAEGEGVNDHDRDVLASLGLFSLMGMGTLFPYNALVSATDWFESLHPEARDVAGKLATSSITSLVVTTVLLLPLTQRRLPPERGEVAEEGGRKCYAMTSLMGLLANPINRIACGFAVECLLLLAFAALEPSIGTAAALAFAVGTGDAICQSGLYVYAARFHVRCTAAVAFGSAVAGLASSLLRIVTKGIFPDTDAGRRAGSAAFFGLAALVLVVCLCALRVTVNRDERIRRAFQCGSSHHRLDEMDLKGEGNGEGFDREGPANFDEVERERAVFELDDGASPAAPRPEISHSVQIERNRCCDGAWSRLETKASDVSDNDVAGSNNESSRCRARLLTGFLPPMAVYRETLMVTWRPTVASFANFFVTLSLFPGTVTSIESTSPRGLGSWLPVVLITAFNLFDCVGRGVLAVKTVADALVNPIGRRIAIAVDPSDVSGHRGSLTLGHELPEFANRVGYPCLGRIVFFPAIWLCVVGDPPWIASDWVRCVIVSCLAVTNGYINAACFMVGPSMLAHRRHQEASSLLLLLSSFLGLMLGGFFGMFLDRFLLGG